MDVFHARWKAHKCSQRPLSCREQKKTRSEIERRYLSRNDKRGETAAVKMHGTKFSAGYN